MSHVTVSAPVAENIARRNCRSDLRHIVLSQFVSGEKQISTHAAMRAQTDSESKRTVSLVTMWKRVAVSACTCAIHRRSCSCPCLSILFKRNQNEFYAQLDTSPAVRADYIYNCQVLFERLLIVEAWTMNLRQRQRV